MTSQSVFIDATELRLDEAGRLFARATRPAGEVAKPASEAAADKPPKLDPGAAEGEVAATLRRAFPWSLPTQFISIRSKDGGEIAMIDDLAKLPGQARELIERYLAQAIFMPEITAVSRIEIDHGFQQWQVQTTAGPLELRVQEREDIRFLSETRFSIKDANGSVYEIPDITKLDAASQTELQKVI